MKEAHLQEKHKQHAGTLAEYAAFRSAFIAVGQKLIGALIPELTGYSAPLISRLDIRAGSLNFQLDSRFAFKVARGFKIDRTTREEEKNKIPRAYQACPL